MAGLFPESGFQTLAILDFVLRVDRLTVFLAFSHHVCPRRGTGCPPQQRSQTGPRAIELTATRFLSPPSKGPQFAKH